MKRLAITLLCLAACRSTPTLDVYNPPTELARNTVEAERLSREGADALDAGNLADAESLLRQALAKDLFYGPAHNNLGVVFLKQEKRYEAANEFEWARKLLPGDPDPRVNLALCFERAGRVDAAIEMYDTALQVRPEYLPAIEGLASLTLKSGRADPRITSLTRRFRIGYERTGLTGLASVASNRSNSACTAACLAGVVVITSEPVRWSCTSRHEPVASIAPSGCTVSSMSLAVSSSPKRRGT
jgi:Tfp pilus assembly protein PilF